MEVFVSVVANPNTFWIHLITEEGIELDNLIDRMNNYYDKHQNDPVCIKFNIFKNLFNY